MKEGKETKDQRGTNRPRNVTTPDLIANVAVAIAEDGRLTVRELAKAYNTSYHSIHNILKNDLGLSKKSARWVPKLLSEEQMQEREQVSQHG